MTLIPDELIPFLSTIGAYAQKAGLRAWVVGGAVRDFYLKRPTLDVDLTFDKAQETVVGFCIRKWGGSKKKFSQFGTYQVKLDADVKLDLARLRTEEYPHPGWLPEVSFTDDIKEDLFRRDFTANAWALSILPDRFGQSVDPYGAQKDIDKGLIRILHPHSFLDDPTRMFRAVRFAGRFGWDIAPKTKQLLLQAADHEYPLLVTRTRIARELLKILEEENLKPIFDLMSTFHLLHFMWPGFTWHPALAKTQNPQMRLGILALSLKDSGENFINSLRLPKVYVHDILAAWKIAQEKLCPIHTLPPFQRELLQLVYPNLPPQALESCFIHGGELKNFGLQGKRISGALTRVRKAQWEGKISSRQEAEKLLVNP